MTEPRAGNHDGALTARHAREAFERHQKIPLELPADQRQQVLELLLTIHRLAMATFDCVEVDMVSQHDMEVLVQIPQRASDLLKIMSAHARKQIAAPL